MWGLLYSVAIFFQSHAAAHGSGMVWKPFLWSALNFFVVSARVFDTRQHVECRHV